MLKAHYDVAKGNGLEYIYAGNAPGNPYEDTYCPKCNDLVIDRLGFNIERWNLTEDMRCVHCGNRIFMAGGKSRRFRHIEKTALY